LGGSEDALQKGYDEAVTKGLNNIHLMSGMHILKDESTNRESTREMTQDIAYLEIKQPMTISGDGRGKTFVEGGGFEILGEKDKKCTFMDMTIQKTDMSTGLHAYDGMSFHCLRCHFTQCNGDVAVDVASTKGRLTDCQITQCMGHGITADGFAVVEINGKETTIDHNCQWNDKDESKFYGIEQCGEVAQIQILSPLTLKSISKNNKGQDNNYRVGHGDHKRIIEVKAFSM